MSQRAGASRLSVNDSYLNLTNDSHIMDLKSNITEALSSLLRKIKTEFRYLHEGHINPLNHKADL